MKRWLIPFAALLLCLFAVVYFQQSQNTKRTSFPAPNFQLIDLNGRSHRLSDYRGQVVFLNLWATWCPPCRDEMPSMERLYRRLQGEAFVMLAISQDTEPNESVRPFVEQLHLSFPILIDSEGKVPPKYGVTGYPETFVIDRNGGVIDHIIGPRNWASEESYRYFSNLITTSAAPPQAAR